MREVEKGIPLLFLAGIAVWASGWGIAIFVDPGTGFFWIWAPVMLSGALFVVAYEQRLQATERRRQRIRRATELLGFKDTGIQARAYGRDPIGRSPTRNWIEIADDPIRWVNNTLKESKGIHAFVPDSRIGLHHPHIRMWVRVQKESVRWEIMEQSNPFDSEFSKIVANHLNQDPIVSAKVLSLGNEFAIRVSTARIWSSWTLYLRNRTKLDRPSWDCYEAIALCLLAMPLADGE